MNYLKSELLPLRTGRLRLRLLEPGEAGLMTRYVNENREHLKPWEPSRVEGYYAAEFWQLELERRQNDFLMGEAVRLVIFFKDSPDGPVVGVCNFTEIMRGAFWTCFLGYSVHHAYQGLGIMREALEAAVDFMFKKFKLHRVIANYMPRNERSGRLLRKLGFNVEGFARDYLNINGKWEDHILTAKIKNNE
jgi:ribosomal-protein-alanine N-acetyltransferase